MNKNPVLEVSHLTKVFGSKKILKSVDLTINQGEIYALIGPNGSGKTTLIKNIVGLLSPEVGSIKIAGYDITKDPLLAKANLGYVPDGSIGFEFFTGREFLYFCASIKNLSTNKRNTKLKELLPLFPIKDILDQPLRSYSRGSLQKVTFIASLLNNPKLLLIDEPVVGLDPSSIEIFGKKLKEEAKKGTAILFVTHMLAFAEDYATRYGFLNKGMLAVEGNVNSHSHLNALYQREYGYA